MNDLVIRNGFISRDSSTILGSLTATTISATTYQNIPTYERKSDFVDPYWYGGFAISGTSESSPTWEIARVEYLSGGTVDTKNAIGPWTDRYILIYT